MSPNNNNDDNSFSDETCVVCFKNVDIYSIGDCDHPVCHQCSTKMRVLCKKNECPICRHDMQKVIFTKCKQPFKELEKSIGNRYLVDRKFQIIFETTSVQNAYNDLLAHICSVCPNRRAFQTFAGLKDHVRKEHELYFCDLCVENLKILTHERRCYTRKELATHKRVGDADDRSHRGHPNCEFCNERYMDNDELYRHLRRDHLYCHFCDADGLHQYYESYDYLRNHFRDQHYLCEEGDCYNEKFTSAFRSDIDLKAHRASVHGRQMTKAAAKQARTLELEFTLKPRARQTDQRRGGGGRNSRYYANTASDEEEGAVGGVMSDSRSSQQARPTQTFAQINMASKDEFPSLGGSHAPMSHQGAHFPRPGGGRGGGSMAMTEADFPALGPDTAPTTSVSVRVNSVSAADRTKGGNSKQNVSIHVNHRPSSITATVSRDHFPALQPTAKPANYSATTKSTNISVSAPQWSTVKSKPAPPPPQTQKKPKPYRYDEEDYTVLNDFPALGGNLPSHISSLAASQWSSGREADAKVTVEKTKSQPPPPKPPQPKTFHIEDDFPSLNSRFDASCSFQQDPKPAKKQPESKPKKESSISIAVDNEWTKVKKSASNTDNISSDSDIGSKKSNKKKKNKSKTKSEPANEPAKSNSAKNTNNNNNEVGKKNKQKEEHKTKAKQIKVEEKNKNEQPKAESSSSSTSSGENLERKRSELKIENLNGQEESGNIDMGDFPSLSNRTPPGFSNAAREKTPAPPGFGSNPPPGFSITLNSVARPPSNGLTFTSSSGQNYPIPSGDATARVFTYVSPPNVKNRNAALLNRVTEALGTQAALDEFLQKSFMFRQGMLSAEMYHSHCRGAMGCDPFNQIFPELLVLLPDIAKQQELWKVAERQTSWRLQVCAACGQVVGGSDLKHHLSTHSLENHFPALTNGSGPSRPNAWTDK